jgi:hypothetical protein
MKALFLYLTLCLFAFKAHAQSKPGINDNNVTYQNIIYTDEINGTNVLFDTSFNSMIQTRLKLGKVRADDPHSRYSKVYFVNKNARRYLKIWGGSDLGYGFFFTIGYTRQGKCADCGPFLGRDNVDDYVVNNRINWEIL